MKYIIKIALIYTVFISFISKADVPLPPGGTGGTPTTPGAPGGTPTTPGGPGGTPSTPGAPASPIDDYIIYLAIVGLFVIYYTYKKSNRLVKN